MAKHTKSEFQLVFPENLKKDTNLSTTSQLAFDDLGDFIEERKRLQRTLEKCQETQLRVDYSEFSNHVFFDSALQKFNIAKSRILTKYPFNGTREEKEAFQLTGSDYEDYVFEQWPRFVGYLEFDGSTQHVSASDPDNVLLLGSSSLYVSAWTNPTISEENIVLQKSIKHDNYIEYSDNFDSTLWTHTNVTVSGSSIAGPIGVSGSTLVENSSLGQHSVTLFIADGLTADNTYNMSAWIKAANRSRVRLDVGALIEVSYNLNTGEVTSIGGSDSSFVTSTNVESFEDGWFRCSVEWVAPSTLAAAMQLLSLDDAGAVSYTGLSQDALYVFGAQISRNPIIDLPPYVRTSGSAIEEKSGYELYFSGAIDPHVNFDIFSGSVSVSVSASYTAYTGSFHNVGVIYDNAKDLLSLYLDGNKISSASAVLGAIDTPSYRLLIGSGTLQEHAAGQLRVLDFYSGSLDEVRIAHTASQLFHEKNFSRPIHAGGEFITGSTNVREPDYLKLYYPFNEGVVGTASIDQNVVDYSKNSLHGKIVGYSSTSRVSGAVMYHDPGNPILYSFHSGVVAFSQSQEIDATLYDNNNNNFIFNMIGEQLLIEDEAVDGLLASFTLAMARFFDEMKLYIDQFDNLRITNYQGVDETPDILLPMLQRYFGWKVTEHFGDVDPLSFFFGEGVLSSSGSLEVPLFEIRNQFWRRILNNLPYLYKTKGKRHNLDAFFNVLGINRDNIRLKEYGYLPGGSIQDDRILRDKPVAFLGIGTGSFGVTSGSFVSIGSASLHTSGAPTGEFSVECMVQLPFVSASYSGSLLTGALWQFDNSHHVFADTLPAGESTGSHKCYWVRDSLLSETGKIVLQHSGAFGGFGASQVFSSSDLDIFNGEFIHVTAGYSSSLNPFISLRGIEGCDITLSEDFSGSSPFSSLLSTQDFIIGANTASVMLPTELQTQGFLGEVRFWNRQLSGSEIDDHALHFESVGIENVLEEPHPLIGHWALNEEIVADTAERLVHITDLSRNGRTATGSGFPAGENPYQRFVREYNHLSPSIDLKWTENKIRIRNKDELKFDEVASDTNEVALEFNLIDSLNEDISKIFSTFDVVNNLVGRPVNKYRDEYSDLESLSRVYFDRLGDSLNFTNFFKLFKWFDKKLSDSIKQLLPARVKFIGGEQVVESHFLERPRYGYKYPIFRTPQDPPEGAIDVSPTEFVVDKQVSLDDSDRIVSEDIRKKVEDEKIFERTSVLPVKNIFSASFVSQGVRLLQREITGSNGQATFSVRFAYNFALTSETASVPFTDNPVTSSRLLPPAGFSGIVLISTGSDSGVSGSQPDLRQGSPFPFSSSLESSMVFNSGTYFTALNNPISNNLSTNDIIIEAVLRGPNAPDPVTKNMYFSKVTGSDGGTPVGDRLYSSGTQVVYEIMTSSVDTGTIFSASVSTGELDPESWYHVMFFVDRQDITENGMMSFVNALPARSSSKPLELTSSLASGFFEFAFPDFISSGSAFCVGAQGNNSDGGQLTASNKLGKDSPIAWLASWSTFTDWFSGSQSEVFEDYKRIATERYQQLLGIREPGFQVDFSGSDLLLGSESPTVIWPSGGYVDVDKDDGVRKLYKVGTSGSDWMRMSRRLDASGSYQVGYLAEPSSVNIIEFSQDFSDSSYWIPISVSVSSSDLIGSGQSSYRFGPGDPGTVSGTVEVLVEDGASTAKRIRASVATTASLRYSFSTWAKPVNRDFVRLFYAGGLRSAYFDVTNGVVGTVANATGTMENWGDGWYRCNMSWVADATIDAVAEIYPIAVDDTPTYLGLSQDAIAIFGAQMEEGVSSGPTSYIKTSGSRVSRAAARLIYSSSILDEVGVGSFSASVLPTREDNLGATTVVAFSSGTDVVQMEILSGLSGSVYRFFGEVSGAIIWDLTGSRDLTDNQLHEFSGSWSNTFVQSQVKTSGVIEDVQSTVVGNLKTTLQMEVGADINGENQLNGLVSTLSIGGVRSEVTGFGLPSRPVSAVPSVDCFCTPKSAYSDGEADVDKNKDTSGQEILYDYFEFRDNKLPRTGATNPSRIAPSGAFGGDNVIYQVTELGFGGRTGGGALHWNKILISGESMQEHIDASGTFNVNDPRPGERRFYVAGLGERSSPVGSLSASTYAIFQGNVSIKKSNGTIPSLYVDTLVREVGRSELYDKLSAQCLDITQDALGNIYSCGYGSDPDTKEGLRHWYVHTGTVASIGIGAGHITVAISESLPFSGALSGGFPTNTWATSIKLDSTNAIYVCGNPTGSDVPFSWRVIKNHITGNLATDWVVLEDVVADNDGPKKLYVDDSDRIWVAGGTQIRYSEDAGVSWMTFTGSVGTGSQDGYLFIQDLVVRGNNVWFCGSGTFGNAKRGFVANGKVDAPGESVIKNLVLSGCFKGLSVTENHILAVGWRSSSALGYSWYVEEAGPHGEGWKTFEEHTGSSRFANIQGAVAPLGDGRLLYSGSIGVTTGPTPSSRLIPASAYAFGVFETGDYLMICGGNNGGFDVPYEMPRDPGSFTTNFSGTFSGSAIIRGTQLLGPVPHSFAREKVSGDTVDDFNNPNVGINFKNEFARKILTNRDRDNEE